MKTNTWIALGAFIFVASFAAATSFNSSPQQASVLKSNKANSSLRSALCTTPVIAVNLASNNPVSSVVFPGMLDHGFLYFDVRAGACDVRLDSFTINRTGASLNSDLGPVSFYNGNNFIIDGILNSQNNVTFTNINLVIPAGTTIPIKIKADISPNAVPGNTVGLRLANTISFTDVQSGISAQQPVNFFGNFMSIASEVLISNFAPTNLTSNSATLNGSINLSFGNPATVWFRYSAPGVISVQTSPQNISGTGTQNFSQNVNGLVGGKTYGIQACGQSSIGSFCSNGPVIAFAVPTAVDLSIQDLKWNSNSFTGAMGNQPILRSPTKPYLYFKATIKNDSLTTPVVIPANTKFTLYKGSISSQNIVGQYTLGSTTTFTIAPNSTKVIQFTSTQNPSLRATAGTFQLIMEADTTNFVQETNETNNTSSYSLTII